MWRALWSWALALAAALAALVPLPGHAHPIDEFQSQALIDLQSDDGRLFDALIFLTRAHLEAVESMLTDLKLPEQARVHELAVSVRSAFSFTDCTLDHVAPDRQLVERANGQWLGFRFRLRCPAAMDRLELRREQYNRDKTRTTLLWTTDIKGREQVQALIPPHLSALTIDLGSGAVVAQTRGGKANTLKDTAPGLSPAQPVPTADFPQPGEAYRPARPPDAVIVAWAEEGALHLAFGPDHLIFLLTLVLAAASFRGLVAGVTGFSIGHLAAMAAAMVNHWPPVPLLDVVIGGTIALSAWRAVADPAAPGWRLAAQCAVFGLVHGLGFGQGLQALTGSSDKLWWPLLSFGVGLDLAQLAWVALASVLWALWRARRPAVAEQGDRRAIGLVLGLAGIAAGVVAFLK